MNAQNATAARAAVHVAARHPARPGARPRARFRARVATALATLATLLMPLLAAAIVGCMPLGPQAGPGEPPVDPTPPEKSVTVVLHFPDKTGRWLEMESRPVSGNRRHEEIALAEWVSGPRSPTLGQFLPPGTTAQLVEVKDGTAFVSLSPAVKNIDAKRSALVLQALVNTMTEIPGISRVQVLVDGKKDGSLSRRIYAAEPLKRDMNCVARQGYRPIPDYDLEAGEMVITGVVSAVDAAAQTISLKNPRVPPEVYSGSGRAPVRIEGQKAPVSGPGADPGAGPGASGAGPEAGAAPGADAQPGERSGARPATALAPGRTAARMVWRASAQAEVLLLGDIQSRDSVPVPAVILELKMPLRVAADAIIHEEDESRVQREISLSDVNVGDVVRMILNPDRSVRAIVVRHPE